jgi:hypothetical protein
MPIFTIFVLAETSDIEQARPLSLEWVKAIKPLTRQTTNDMLPTPLSPTGNNPPTHHLCCMTISMANVEHMKAWIHSHHVPVIAESAIQLEDTKENQLANRDAWLATKGLKVVS